MVAVVLYIAAFWCRYSDKLKKIIVLSTFSKILAYDPYMSTGPYVVVWICLNKTNSDILQLNLGLLFRFG